MGQEAVGERKGQGFRCPGESGIDLEIAFWPGNYGVKTRLLPFSNRQIKAKSFQLGGEFFGVGGFRRKVDERAAFWGVNGRVNGILSPLDEEGQEASVRIRERQRLPLQESPVRSFT